MAFKGEVNVNDDEHADWRPLITSKDGQVGWVRNPDELTAPLTQEYLNEIKQEPESSISDASAQQDGDDVQKTR